jgi:DNA-directed RNA polymerase specialized sigma24 family protein
MHKRDRIPFISEQDETAYERMVAQYKPVVERFAFQLGVPPNDLPDIMQAVFHRLFRDIAQLEEDSLWIFQTTLNTIKAYHPKSKQHQRSVPRTEKKLPFSQQFQYYFEKEVQFIIHKSLQGIDMKYKAPLILFYFHDKTCEEIATILSGTVASMKKRINRGKTLLKHQYEKNGGQEVIVHEEKQYNSLLHEMTYCYERLPEFIEMESLLTYIPKQMVSKWRKRVPAIVAVIGLLLFAVFSIQYVQDERERIALEKKEKEEKEATPVEEDKKAEVDPEILAYLEQKKKDFAQELGLQDVSHLLIVLETERTIKEFAQQQDFPIGNNIEETKRYIDMMLTLPSQIMGSLNPQTDKGGQDFISLVHISAYFTATFQQYLNELLKQYHIPKAEFGTLVNVQKNPENYDGTDALKQFLHSLNEQNMKLVTDNRNGMLQVEVDYSILKERLTEIGYNAGYVAFIDYTIQTLNVQYNDRKTIEELLLTLEEILVAYGDQYTTEIKNYLFEDVDYYLNIYLMSWEQPHQLTDQEKELYYKFLENRQDSVYWEVVRSKVKEWEENDWENTPGPVDVDYVKVLMDDRFQNIHYQNMVKIQNWPYVVDSITVYQNVKNDADHQFLQELNPFETISLFAYAYQKGDEEFYTKLWENVDILNEQAMEVDWKSLQNSGVLTLTKYESKEAATVYFLDIEQQPLFDVKLEKVDGIWKIKEIANSTL